MPRILRAVDRVHERKEESRGGRRPHSPRSDTGSRTLVLLSVLAEYRGKHHAYDLRYEIGPIHDIAERVARNGGQIAAWLSDGSAG